jgi:4-hydroxy-tetrahydrodipicolinate synthase
MELWLLLHIITKQLKIGLVAHYKAIAENTNLPIILYSVPSRTGVNILPETCKKLSEIENIVAIKEASGNISQIAEIANLCGEDLHIYSGNDDQIVPILSLGGIGVISVLSNVMPKYTHDITEKFFEGKIEESRKMQLDALNLIKALFSEVNPIPVKSALNMLGYNFGEPRLPLVPMTENNKEKLQIEMEKLGILN